MRVVTFNINGIRARPHQLERLVERYEPDIIGLQETKVVDEEFPLDGVQALGYQAQIFGQKGHYGVAVLSRSAPLTVTRGLPADTEESQRRLIAASFATPSGTPLTLINAYFPQGESRDHPLKFPAKRQFYADLAAYLQGFSADDQLLVIGDMNIAPVDLDIGIGEENAKRWRRSGKCSFLPEEREWMASLLGWGLHDCFRERHPEANDQFSWFDYRSRGFEREPRHGLRIDLVLASRGLWPKCREVGIAYDIRGMERPSDHCPVWADFDL